VGRKRQLDALADAFEDMEGGQTVTVLVHGPSGIGKSVLIQHFLNGLRQRPGQKPVILIGRCYEREAVPYKALYGLVDALSRFWKRLPLGEAEALLPRDVGPLVRVFPVLEQVNAVAAAPRRDTDVPDPQELRRRAFAGLREVLFRTGARWRLVVYLDDLQWGDLDSAVMMTDLLLPPEPPRLLLLASFRSEDRESSPFLFTFLKTLAGPGTERHDLALDVLNGEEARDLASRLLREPNPAAAEAIARESRGNPFFIYELVQAFQDGERDVTLDKVIRRRVSALPEDQRVLLEVVAVAGRPLRHTVALRAAGLENQSSKCLIDLKAASLLRGGPTEQPEVEVYHDRIRETVVAHLVPQVLTEYHRRLALALEALGGADVEVLASHFHACEEPSRASVYYEKAAENAMETLAFERAARLYSLALELRPVQGDEKHRLQTHLGDALVNAGRGAEAAEAYLAAVTTASAGQALDLQRRAADQLLRTGHIEKGLATLRDVLRSVGIGFPATPRRAWLALLWGRLRIWWLGTKFRERSASQIPPEELVRIDVCWSAASGLSLVDLIRGMAFHARHYLLALGAGEPRRVAQALATQVVQNAMAGSSRQARAEALLCLARELAERIDDRYARAMVDSMGGCAAMLLGQWQKAYDLSEGAEETWRKECRGVAWELSATYHYRFTAMKALGQWQRCAEELPVLLREAQQRGDLFATTSLSIDSCLLHLAADEPEQARQTVEQAMSQWRFHGFHIQHCNALTARTEVALYAGNAEQAWELMTRHWPELQQSMLLRVQKLRLDMLRLRARSALATAATASAPARGRATAAKLLHAAARDARAMERERAAWADPGAKLIRAGIAALDGNKAEAIRLLAAAGTGFDAADMSLFAAASNRRRGLLLGGDEGRKLVEASDALMAAQMIRNPGRITNMLAPGFTEMR
jgi:hypothetical protein